ncbi:MAG: leucine-rich repeat domain-containing protein [Pirellulales bacterium]
MKLRFALMLLVCLLLMAAPVSARKWTSSDGKFSVEAELVEAKDGNVRLKRQDGKVITVPVSKLSKADQDYLSSMATAAKTPDAATVKKLTVKEAAEVMAWGIGKWETKGRGMPVEGAPQAIEMTREARWKEEGKSVEYKFTMDQDGKTVSYFGHLEYDAAKGVFIYRSKWGGNPETTSHEVYDPATRTSHGQSAPTTPVGWPRTTTITKRIGNNKTQQTLQVFVNGRLTYSHEVVSTRINGDTAPAGKAPANKAAAAKTPDAAKPTPDEVIAAIKEMARRVTVDKGTVVAVSLKGTKVTDAGLVHLKRLTSLKILDLSNTKVTDAGLVHLKGLTKLEKLSLNDTKVTDAGLEHLKGLTKLESLSLWDTKVTDAGLEHLKGMTELKKLSLLNTKITDAGLVHLKGLTNLEVLNLTRTKITDAGLVHLKGLTGLLFLYLNRTKVTDAGVNKLQQALPKCKIAH